VRKGGLNRFLKKGVWVFAPYRKFAKYFLKKLRQNWPEIYIGVEAKGEGLRCKEDKELSEKKITGTLSISCENGKKKAGKNASFLYTFLHPFNMLSDFFVYALVHFGVHFGIPARSPKNLPGQAKHTQ